MDHDLCPDCGNEISPQRALTVLRGPNGFLRHFKVRLEDGKIVVALPETNIDPTTMTIVGSEYEHPTPQGSGLSSL